MIKILWHTKFDKPVGLIWVLMDMIAIIEPTKYFTTAGIF